MQPVRRKRRNGRFAFKAVEAEARAALLAGATVVAVYDALSDRLGMSYSQFARYVQTLRAQRAAVPAARPLEAPRVIDSAEPVPSLNMDSYAAKALKNDNLF